jgi:membrane-associated phospholipid phosphatase
MLPDVISPIVSPRSRLSKRVFVVSLGNRLKLVAAIAFALSVLTSLVITDRLLALDTISEQMIASLELGAFHYLVELAGWFGKPLGLVVSLIIAGCLLLWQRRYRLFWFVIQSSTIGFFLTGTLKPIFHRVRPGVDVTENLYCYPSGHTLGAMFVYGSLLLVVDLCIKNRLVKNCFQIVLVSLIILIGFSRIYYNTHYPSDVVASYLIGLLYFLITPQTYKPRRKF